MDDVAFKPRAFEKAAETIESLDESLEEVFSDQGEKGLLKIPGVGKGIAEHIVEVLKTGKLTIHEKLKKKYPVAIAELTSVEGIGPKTVKVLYKKLKIRNLEDLKKAAAQHKLSALPHFGKKSEDKILQKLGAVDQTTKRFLLGSVFGQVTKLCDTLIKSGLFKRLEIGGSFRRRQETVGDIDLLGIAVDAKRAMDFFV